MLRKNGMELFKMNNNFRLQEKEKVEEKKIDEQEYEKILPASTQEDTKVEDNNLNSLLKTIMKDPSPALEMNSFRVTVNKTSDLEQNTDTLKKLSSSGDKPNNQTKFNSTANPLPPGQMKCNILKGKYILFIFIL